MPSVRDPEQRLQARWLASLLVVSLPLGVLVAAAPGLVKPGRTVFGDRDLWVLVSSLVFWIAAYGLTRMGRYRVAVGMTITITSAVLFGIYFFDFDLYELNYLLIPILFGSATLPSRVMVLYVAINLAAMLLLPVFRPELTYTRLMLEPVSFVGTGAILAMLFTRQQRRLAEYRRARLAESESGYRTLLQSVFDGIVIQEGGRVVEANPSVARMFGYDLQELIGESALDLIRSVGKGEIARTSTGGKCYEIVGVRRDGSMFPAEIIIREHTYRGRSAHILAIRDITQRREAEEAQRRYAERLETSLEEKEVLLKEIHHRVKNNLQIVSSMLSLQADALEDPRVSEALQESQDRIRSMAFIHERLYRSVDLTWIDFAGYAHMLTTALFRSYVSRTQSIGLNVETDDTLLDIDTAIPCGLILNELVSNALKHAFPNKRSGEITIGLHTRGKHVVLTVSDDGIGLPPDLDFRNAESLGLQLVITLVKQLEGTIELDRNEGTLFRIALAPGSSERI
jgi:PAS domain S-box-containing protein